MYDSQRSNNYCWPEAVLFTARRPARMWRNCLPYGHYGRNLLGHLRGPLSAPYSSSADRLTSASAGLCAAGRISFYDCHISAAIEKESTMVVIMRSAAAGVDGLMIEAHIGPRKA